MKAYRNNPKKIVSHIFLLGILFYQTNLFFGLYLKYWYFFIVVVCICWIYMKSIGYIKSDDEFKTYTFRNVPLTWKSNANVIDYGV